MTDALEILSLPVDCIAIGERIGFFSASHAERIGESMLAHGQQSPIHVRRNGNRANAPWMLVAGLHRLRAAKAIGLHEIKAIQVADDKTNADDLRRLELAENLSHKHRRPIERAIMMTEYGRLEEAIDHPGHVGETSQARALRVRQTTSVTVTDVCDWRQRTADAFNVSLSTFERHQRIYREIVEAMPDLAEALNDHPLGESLRAMGTLAGLPLDKADKSRRIAAETLLTRDDWKSISEVLVAAKVRRSTGFRVDSEKLGAVMMDTWSKMPPIGRKAHVDWLALKVTPGQAKSMVATFKKRGLL